MRGFGRVFKRGSTYWIAYCYRGKEHRESSHSDNEATARKLLKKRVGEMGQGKLIGPSEERLTFDDLASMLLTVYEVNGKRSLESTKLSIRHLREFFGSERAVDITLDRVRAYVRERQREGATNGSINRELAALKRAFTLATRAGKLGSAPYIPWKRTTRAEDFSIMAASSAAFDNAPVTSLYLSGWRVSEMRTLEWRDVDLP